MSDSSRHLTKHGHDVVVNTLAQGGKDDYGDATLTTTPSTVKAIQDMDARRAGVSRDSSGAIPTGEALFYLDADVTISDGGATQASEIVDRGSTFTVVQADNLDNDLQVIVAERNRA